MRQSTITNHINPRPTYNCTHVNAWALGHRISKWSRYNLRYMFRPPVLEAVAIVPMVYNPDDDKFSPEMFDANCIFSDTLLNHYLRLRRPNNPNTFLINAGFLLNRFALGDSIGYATLKGALDLAEEEFTSSDDTHTQTPDSQISITSTD